VKGIPGTLQEGGAGFGTTRWSIVEACADEDEMAASALSRLCRDYWPPLYTFARRRGHGSSDAQDMVQGFFAYLLQSKAYRRTDRRKGKFRSFLIASFKNYMADTWDREHAVKRGGNGEFALLNEETDAVEALYAQGQAGVALTDEQQYERDWALALVARALKRLEAEHESGSKLRLFEWLKPFLTGGAGLPSHEEVARQVHMPVETLRSHISRLRAHYRVLLREEVARTIGVAEDVDEELRQLCRILTAAY
jgi:RNA polymerase sigma-70 factor (ECF subfamily)